MGEDVVTLITQQITQQNIQQKDFQTLICNMLAQGQNEARATAARLHERMDQILAVSGVTSADCENRRNQCRNCMNSKIEKVTEETDVKVAKATGYPPWVIVAIGGFITLTVTLIAVIIDLMKTMGMFNSGGAI